jgi:glucan phosphoethanolaminetransferase (alkaline phosphatase superfamily)
MEITYIGWVAIPLGFVLLLTRPDFLYNLMIFFIPFSATAIINVGSVGSGSGVPITMFFGSLYLFYKFTHICVTRKIKLPRIQTLSIQLIWIFGVAATVSSLLMPIIIDGQMLIASPTLSSNEVYPLTFSMTNLTQVIYLIYAICLTTVVAKRNLEPIQFKATLKIYLLSAFFVTAWGWLQVVCYYTDIPYPDIIFNNSITMSAQGYTAEFGELGLKRVSSVAVEPAVLAQYLMTVIPIVLFSVNHNEPILNSSKADKMILLATISLLLITTSTTAYVGLV